jgi:hypothetical protein
LERQEVDVMANSIAFRMVIQKPTGTKDKFYVGVIKGSITHEHPFKISVANVTIDSTAGPDTQYYLAPVAIDDIVRIQVNSKMDVSERDVWLDLFEGRISKITNGFSATANKMVIHCKGHGNPMTYTYFDSDKTFTNQTTGYIISAMLSSLSRITDAAPSLIDQTGSTT